MNKKLIYLFVILVTSIFLLSACQQEAVGRKVMNANIGGKESAGGSAGGSGEITGGRQVTDCYCSGTGNCALTSSSEQKRNSDGSVGTVTTYTCSPSGYYGCGGGCQTNQYGTKVDEDKK